MIDVHGLAGSSGAGACYLGVGKSIVEERPSGAGVPILVGNRPPVGGGLEPVGSMNEVLLSVVLPNFNHARYLTRAVDAIAGQDSPPDEIIVIDDASSDDSREVLLECQRRHANLTILVNERNLGALLSLQRGLEAAKGRYVYFAAADDQILPGFFGNAIRTLETAPGVGLFCAETILVDGATGRKLGRRPVVRPLRGGGRLAAREVEDLLRRADNFIHTGSTIFRRQAVLDHGGFRVEAGSFSDGLLARKIALAEGMWFMPTAGAIWHIHAGGLSRRTALVVNKAVDALLVLPGLIARDPAFPPWYAELFQRRWRFGSARLALDVTPPDRNLLRAMAPDTRLDHAVIAAVAPFLRFRVARLATLAWLTLRLRPFRLRDVAITALDRWKEGSAASDGSWPDELQARRELE
jgi:glycosyltransferase involved in cell wall biosynthesis